MRPSDEAILKAIAEHFNVSTAIAKAWLDDMASAEERRADFEKHDL